MAIKGGVWDVGEHNVPTTNTTSTTNTNATSTLRGIMTHGTNLASASTVGTHNAFTIGGCDGINQGMVSFSDIDALAVMVSSEIQNNDNVYRTTAAAATATSSSSSNIGVLSSFGTSAFTLSYSSTDGVGSDVPYWAVSQAFVAYTRTTSDTITTSSTLFKKAKLPIADAVEIGDSGIVKTQVVRFQKSTGASGITQDVALNFTPKAIIVFSANGTVDGTSEAYMQESLGFYDGTTMASYVVSSRDAVGPTHAGRIHFNDRIWCKTFPTSPQTIEAYATCVFGTNKVTFTWTLNDAVATDITIWAFGGAGITGAKVNTVDVGRSTCWNSELYWLGFHSFRWSFSFIHA